MSTLLLVFLLGACTSIGRHTITGPVPTSTEAVHTPVVIIVVEGLRNDALNTYLETLRINDYEPNWPSGLSILNLEGFKFGKTDRAESVAPASGIAALASIVTGRYPDNHSLVGARFVETSAHGSNRRFALDEPMDASTIWYQRTGDRPTDATPPGSHLLLGSPTWISQLARQVPVSVAYHPFGFGADWKTPANRQGGVLALVGHASSTLAVPLLDGATENSLIELLLGGKALILADFRGVHAATCYRQNATCDGTITNLQAQQQGALKRIDSSLARAFRRYLLEQPERFRKTSFLLVGSQGLVNHTYAGGLDNVHVIGKKRLLDHIGTHVTNGCMKWYQSIRNEGQLHVIFESGVARIYLPRCVPGQCGQMAKPRACLGAAVASMANKTQWLAGATWLAEIGVTGQPRSQSYVIKLKDSFRQAQPAHRRDRLLRKIRRSIDNSTHHRTGDFVLFASKHWVFLDREQDVGRDFVHRAGLSVTAMQVPLLIADRRLAASAATDMRTAPLELTDIGPTVYTLLGMKPPSTLTRPSIFKWRSKARKKLDFNKADRTIVAAKHESNLAMTWSESASEVMVGIRESGAHWPPDRIRIGFGKLTYKWDPDKATFPDGTPCTYEADKVRRIWRCRFPVDRKTNAVEFAEVTRGPNPNGKGDYVEKQTFVLGEAVPKIVAGTLTCATREYVDISLNAEDPLGLGHVFASFGNHDGSQAPMKAATIAEVDLSTLNPCEKVQGRSPCREQSPPTRFRGTVRIPLTPHGIRQSNWSETLLGQEESFRKANRHIFSQQLTSSYRGSPPKSVWLTLRVCNIASRCDSVVVATDIDYIESLSNVCAPHRNAARAATTPVLVEAQ